MCGRYSFAPSLKQVAEQLDGIDITGEIHPSYNIAPTHRAYVITNDQPHTLQTLAWGLVPHWSRDGANRGKLINARAEGIEDKPSFRRSIRTRRCLVPADSFYEWRTDAEKRKIPYRILGADGKLIFLAGIWDEWGHGAERLQTFSIITTAPNADVAALHDRMPVIFNTREQRDAWLGDLPLEEVLGMLHPPEEGTLKLYRVSERLNAPGSGGSELQNEVPEEPGLF